VPAQGIMTFIVSTVKNVAIMTFIVSTVKNVANRVCRCQHAHVVML